MSQSTTSFLGLGLRQMHIFVRLNYVLLIPVAQLMVHVVVIKKTMPGVEIICF